MCFFSVGKTWGVAYVCVCVLTLHTQSRVWGGAWSSSSTTSGRLVGAAGGEPSGRRHTAQRVGHGGAG